MRHPSDLNLEIELLNSAARTANTSTDDQVNRNARGVMLFLDITANPGGVETLTVSIEAKLGGKYFAITAFAATAAATNAGYGFAVYPGAVETTNVGNFQTQGEPVPRTWRARVVHSGAGSWTYSLHASSLV